MVSSTCSGRFQTVEGIDSKKVDDRDMIIPVAGGTRISSKNVKWIDSRTYRAWLVRKCCTPPPPMPSVRKTSGIRVVARYSALLEEDLEKTESR